MRERGKIIFASGEGQPIRARVTSPSAPSWLAIDTLPSRTNGRLYAGQVQFNSNWGQGFQGSIVELAMGDNGIGAAQRNEEPSSRGL